MRDEELVDMLRRAANEVDPDSTRIRARFEEVTATRWPTPVGRGSTRPLFLALPAALLAAVVVLVSLVVGGTLVAHQRAHQIAAGRTVAHASRRGTQAPTAIGSGVFSSAPTAPSAPSSVRDSGGPVPTSTGATASPSATVVAPDTAARCRNMDAVVLGRMRISDNLWNEGAGHGWQCVKALSSSGSMISWTTSWSWAGGPGTVKSYASAVLGWHWGWPVPGTGLPIRLSARQNVLTRWSYTLSTSPGAQQDVGYDVWFHTTPTPTTTSPAAEMRIVVAQLPSVLVGATSGRPVLVDGAIWTLSVNSAAPWPLYTFTRAQSTSTVDLNLRDFTDLLGSAQAGRSHSPLDSPLSLLGPSLYLSSVEAGTDVISGAGTMLTRQYSVSIGR